ncbi:Dihydroxy-acid dehydratase, partial [Trichinella spiralis]
RVCGWVPPKTACGGMLLVNPLVYSIGGEAH